MNEKWDRRFMNIAKEVASWSKDPSTKVGAHIVRTDRTPVSYGYNGFPRGVKDTEDRYINRDVKYKLVVHAEENAILNAHGLDLRGCILYATALPCARCAASIIQVGIAEVVAPEPSLDYVSRWADDIKLTKTMFEEAGVALRVILGA